MSPMLYLQIYSAPQLLKLRQKRLFDLPLRFPLPPSNPGFMGQISLPVPSTSRLSEREEVDRG